jgi:hypothetical protein
MLRAVRISILPLALVAMAVHASAALRIDVLRPVAALRRTWSGCSRSRSASSSRPVAGRITCSIAAATRSTRWMRPGPQQRS